MPSFRSFRNLFSIIQPPFSSLSVSVRRTRPISVFFAFWPVEVVSPPLFFEDHSPSSLTLRRPAHCGGPQLAVVLHPILVLFFFSLRFDANDVFASPLLSPRANGQWHFLAVSCDWCSFPLSGHNEKRLIFGLMTHPRFYCVPFVLPLFPTP